MRDLRGYDYEGRTGYREASPPPALHLATATETSSSRWERLDLGDIARQIRAGTIARPKPTVARIENAGALF